MTKEKNNTNKIKKIKNICVFCTYKESDIDFYIFSQNHKVGISHES